MPKSKNELTNSTENQGINEMNEDFTSEFEIDPSLLTEEFNCKRAKRFPYGVVINSENAGLFIPEKNLSKAGWLIKPELVEKELPGGVETGLFLTNARIIVLGFVDPYLKYKDNEAVPVQLRNTMIDWYDGYAGEIDKKMMDAVSEHLIMFLDQENNFLHEIPIRIRFKNVALWNLKETLDRYYSEAELTFARLMNLKPSSKDDKWRALCVIQIQFKGIKEGKTKESSYCCKVADYLRPDAQNFPKLFMGTRIKMNAVIEKYDSSMGFDEQLKLMLPEPVKFAALPEGKE
ncbi:DUF5895 domain-containing protein [Dolichospermum circinale CS-1225]|uniref:DUF5895 domain-containing protein n=1 Tax=Dolichospermum circinale TaxID=109265 RepID=UPI002330533B|nr:DUF5895 domain-containing protein [Dolichospermum circinale]MDB9521237.1 DUF5895 domain-containing protein [Dolichospermum circinale CS-1225]